MQRKGSHAGLKRRLSALPKNATDTANENCQILVHNVSHSDLLLSLELGKEYEHLNQNAAGSPPNLPECLIARPSYGMFQTCSTDLIETWKENGYTRDNQDSCRIIRHEIIDGYGDVNGHLPIGFEFANVSSKAKDWKNYHLRPTVDKKKLAREYGERTINVKHVFLPLIGLIMHRWMKDSKKDFTFCESIYSKKKYRRIVYLLSGEGDSRNPAHGTYNNSTKGTAQLMKMFMEMIFPDINVHIIHSEEGIFKYQENIQFMLQEVIPLLNLQRKQQVEIYGEKWTKKFQLTISLSDGAPARLLAVCSSLRGFSPRFLHISQPKKFFHFNKMDEDDIENHSYDLLEALPPTPVCDTNEDIRLLVEEMQKHQQVFMEAKSGHTNELSNFWLRKSNKPVLCVLMYQKQNDLHPTFIRGMNVEVSMPTGSLCSERNAIGNALANDPTLVRSDFKMIAILSVTLDMEYSSKTKYLNPLDPCGSCSEWIKKISEVNPDFKVITFENISCKEVYVKEIL